MAERGSDRRIDLIAEVDRDQTHGDEPGLSDGGDPGGVRAVAHDLRQPIAAIEAAVTTIAQSVRLTGAAAEALALIRREAREVGEMAASLLDLDMTGTARVDRVVADVVQRARTVHGCRILVHTEHAIANGTELTWRRVLGNVVENACRASGPEGHVVVAVRSSSREVIVDITDSGAGFGAGDVGAAGLGLAFVLRSVTALDGRVEIGREPDGGTRVTVRVPVPDNR